MNTPSQEQEENETSSASFGEQIRHAREDRKLSIDDLVGETRINPQHLIDLEEGNTSGIGAQGYIVGYLRTLAKVLDLNAEELIDDFKSSSNQAKHQTIDPEHELLPPKPKNNSLGWGTIVATTIIVLAGIGALIYYWLEVAPGEGTDSPQSEIVEDEKTELDDSEQANFSSSEQRETAEPIDQSIGSGDIDQDSEGPTEREGNRNLDVSLNGEGSEYPPDSNGPNTGSEQTSSSWEDFMNSTQLPQDDEPTDTETEITQDDSNETVEDAQETTVSEETDEAAQEIPALVFEFSDDSFVEVTDANDNQLVNETKKAGSKLELDGTAPFTIRLGSARSVTLLFNGDEIDLTPHTRRNIAELNLPP